MTEAFALNEEQQGAYTCFVRFFFFLNSRNIKKNNGFIFINLQIDYIYEILFAKMP